ncbi:MAG: hypothetical protein LBN05_03115 [Oscillospiraceae bacterium]|jgi:hypothetical protein|nr:hypothetical protein [Oscillospiraceae bacterium]
MKKTCSTLLALALVLTLTLSAFAAAPVDYPDGSDSASIVETFVGTLSALSTARKNPPADPQAAAAALAAQAQYTLYTLADGKKSVTIAFRADTPEAAALLDSATLQAFAHALAEAQKNYGDADTVYMTQTHIAGEARLHIAGYWFTRLLGGARGLLKANYEDFRVADLNVDEDRLPWWMFIAAGLF